MLTLASVSEIARFIARAMARVMARFADRHTNTAVEEERASVHNSSSMLSSEVTYSRCKLDTIHRSFAVLFSIIAECQMSEAEGVSDN